MHLLDHIPHIRLNFKHFYTFSFMQLRQKIAPQFLELRDSFHL